MIAMIEAARTSTSAAGLGAVVVVAVAGLAFWLGMLAIVSRDPGGARRRRRAADMLGPVVGGTHVSDCARSVAPSRRSAAIFAGDEEEVFFAVPTQRSAAEAAGAAERVSRGRGG